MKAFLSLVVTALTFGTSVAQADIYLSVEGAQQGKFKGESVSKLFKDRLNVVATAHEINSPRDPITGMATGRRQHKVFTVNREVSGASPQFLLALANNENLKTVVLEFTQLDSRTGIEQIFYTIKLTNAAVANLKTTSASDPVSSLRGKLFEEVSFAYQSIEVEHAVTKASASDSWYMIP